MTCTECGNRPATTPAMMCPECYGQMVDEHNARIEDGACTACGRTDSLNYCEDCDPRPTSDLQDIAFAMSTDPVLRSATAMLS